ncbi:MAG: ABC transporter ATP-binding protein [Veillonellaceae bacterium]|jgi:energy-coupling factor transport system ATP-binding protein|nr:ABC transporter ATP-binding protein [Veillonellaceae bacterium]
MAAITFNNFSYAYKHTQKALDNISITVEQGSFTAVIGRSGAGKTTLCLAVAGAVPHYFGGSLAGSVTVDNMSTQTTAMHDLAQSVGTVLQDYETQLVTMTVEEEVAFSLENRGLGRNEIAACVSETLAKVGLTGFEKKEVSALSGGQKQRLVIASVLASNPKILVLDEPTSALDPEGTESIYKLLAELNKEYGITIIVVEHETARVLPYADQFILMENGQCIQSADPDQVLTYMWKHQIYTEAIPPLWELKLTLQDQTGVRFSAWRNEQDAVDELRKALKKEACISA